MYDTLLACAELAEKEEINLNLEALNITTDHVATSSLPPRWALKSFV